MADYIDKEILCEAYLHIDPKGLPHGKHGEFLATLKTYSEARAKFFLYSDVELETESKEGSLTAYITIAGAVSVYYAIAQYPDFRAGVIAMYEDVKRLAETIISEGLFNAKARRGDIIRVEARTGIIGSMRVIVSIVDKLVRSDSSRSQEWMLVRLTELGEAISSLLEKINSPEDREFIRKGLLTVLKRLPERPTVRRGKESNKVLVGRYEKELRQIRLELKGQKRIRLPEST